MTGPGSWRTSAAVTSSTSGSSTFWPARPCQVSRSSIPNRPVRAFRRTRASTVRSFVKPMSNP